MSSGSRPSSGTDDTVAASTSAVREGSGGAVVRAGSPNVGGGSGGDRTIRELAPGQVLDGRYRLVERIGRGGFGDVWRAVELLPDGGSLRDVALKLLSPEMDNTGWAEEAKLLASFSHPSLVTIYATGILDQPRVPFVAMELLIGETLADLLRRTGPLPWRLALRYVREVARALDVIHVRGVIHLDLKPANIFVTEDGRVKVLDFGISRTRATAGTQVRAKLPSDVPTQRDMVPPHPELSFDNLATAAFLAGTNQAYAATQLATGDQGSADSGPPKVIVGTPGYVAPEVLQAATPTMLADVYALGATLAVLVTGKLPQDVPEEPPDTGSLDEFRTYWLSLRDSTLRGSLRDFHEFQLPRGLVNLLTRFCAVDPDRRGIAEGTLGAVLDESWERPHGIPDLPYPGRSPFTEAHEGFLFGRDQDLVRAERHLAFEPILVVSGPIGAGKTSFIRAALLPSLAKSGVDGSRDVEVQSITAGSGPDRSLFGTRAVDDLLTLDEGHGRVVFIDDFEEVLGFPEADRQRTILLIENLLLGHRHRGFRLVLAIDQECVSAVLDLSQTLLALAASVRYLTPPPEALARDIAIEPALRAGWTVLGEQQLVATIAKELATVPVPLPTIAQILAESTSESEAVVPTSPESELVNASKAPSSAPVVERRVLDGRIMDDASILTSIHRAAERVWRTVGHDEEAMLDLLVMLTTSEGQPIRVSKAHIADRLGKDSIDDLVGRMQKRMLVVQRAGDIELAHPGLSKWAKLENARLSSLDQIALRERIAEASAAWEKASMSSAYLARGSLLAEVDRQGVELRALSGVEVEFLSVSRRAQRRRRLVQFGVLALASVAVALGFFYRENLVERKRRAEARQVEADQRALRVGLVARARQARDPYERVAYFVAAVKAGAAEPALFVELLGAVSDLPPGRFLSLEPLDSVQLPWNDRWVIGRSPSGSLVIFDLRSPLAEPESLEHVDPTIDPSKASVVHRPPKRFELAIGDAPVVDVLPVRFDTAAFVQNAIGEVHLVRMRESGEVAVAAVAPFRCRGEMTVADRAPVFACNSAGDAAIWRLDTAEVFRVSQPKGVFVLSPDGDRLLTWFGDEVLVHEPAKNPIPIRLVMGEEVLAAAESPRDRVIGVATKSKLSVHGIEDGLEILKRPGSPEAVRVVWDKRGLDVGVCTHERKPTWHFALEGERPAGLPAPSARCDRASELAPDFTSERFELGDFAYKNFGDHFSRGAWQLPGDRFLSTTLLLAGAREDGLSRVLEFALRDGKEEPMRITPDTGFTRIVRSRDAAVVELARSNAATLALEPPEIVVAAATTGVRLQSSRGYLLDACDDGRVLAYEPDADRFAVRDVRGNRDVGKIPRMTGRVLGLSPNCETIYTQDLDGTIYASTVSGSVQRKRVATAHGHVFEVKRIGAAGTEGAGLLMGLSSGEVIRVREATDEAELLARANPRVSALGAGVTSDVVFFADQTGVYEVELGKDARRIAPPRIDSAWQDIIASKGGDALVLASPNEVAVYDLTAGAVTGSARLDGLTRGLVWDESGSVMLYPQASQGVARGELLPFGPQLPEIIGSLASNLRAEPAGALLLKR